MTEKITVWFNPACSKCLSLHAILDEHGRTFEPRYYLEAQPSPSEIEELLTRLELSDPIELMRRKDKAFTELGVEEMDRPARIAALCSHPSLLERPILVMGDRAVVARPPQKVLAFFTEA